VKDESTALNRLGWFDIHFQVTLLVMTSLKGFRPPVRNTDIRGSIQKFPGWPPGARTADGTALCH